MLQEIKEAQAGDIIAIVGLKELPASFGTHFLGVSLASDAT